MNGSIAGPEVALDGATLSAQTVTRIARGRVVVSLTAAARERIVAGRGVIDRALAAGQPVYGLTTALGDRAGEPLPREVLQEFSYDVVRGRAMATGSPLAPDVVRALMAVRVNTIATGGSGASPAVAEHILAVLNAGLVPEMPELGSAGASDLCVMAHLGLALIGEGGFLDPAGERVDAGVMLERHGLAPLRLGPKDGLVLCANNACSVGRLALACCDAGRCLESAQTIAAMTMEGFRANPSPLDPRAAAARPQPGQERAAAGLLRRLAGSRLLEPGGARRLQDPLSLRCVASTHAAGYATLDALAAALDAELNGAGDNPLVLAGEERVLPTGNFQMPVLTIAADAVGQALAHVAAAATGRCARLLTALHTDLPANLSPHQPQGSGMAPLFKPVEALLDEIRLDATATPAGLSAAAHGVEDTSVNAALAGKKLERLIANLERLLAIEAVMAAQAIDLAGVGDVLPPSVAVAQRAIRSQVPMMDADTPMSEAIRAVAAHLVRGGRLADPAAGSGAGADVPE